MLGPPIFRFRLPFTARIESRISSASSRRMSNRQSRSFSGSFASAFGLALRRHAVGAGQHDQPVQRLQLPAAARTSSRGQPVQQLRDASACRPGSRSCWACARCRGRSGTARGGSPSRAPSAGSAGWRSSAPAPGAARRTRRTASGAISGAGGAEHRQEAGLDHVAFGRAGCRASARAITRGCRPSSVTQSACPARSAGTAEPLLRSSCSAR